MLAPSGALYVAIYRLRSKATFSLNHHHPPKCPYPYISPHIIYYMMMIADMQEGGCREGQYPLSSDEIAKRSHGQQQVFIFIFSILILIIISRDIDIEGY